MSKKILVISIVALLLTGCQIGQMPFVYHPPKQQGNVITDKQVTQLKAGQSKQQVQAIIGSPLLRTPFNSSEWHYVYRYQRHDKAIQQKSLTLTFDGDQLTTIERSNSRRI